MKCPRCNYNNAADALSCAECSASLVSSDETPYVSRASFISNKKLALGSTFAQRYHVIEEIGRGGMGQVYKVLDKEIDEKIALKLINAEIAINEETIERFRKELKFARKISHKNVCRMFDLGKFDDIYYIAMEYVEGEDLKSFIRKVGQVPLEKALSITTQLCEGLSEAHHNGIVHRDLKPQNIMIDKMGNTKIMDFGIARCIDSKGLTGAGLMIGTPEYMSPEQAEGTEVDCLSDMYSVGVILYEMITGRVPFKGETPLSIAMKHLTETPPDPAQFNAQIPPELTKIILTCMEKKKENRYQSIEELNSALISITDSISTMKSIRIAKPRTSKQSKQSRRRFFIYGSVIALIIIAISTGIFLFKQSQQNISSIAVLPLANLSGDLNQDYFADGITEALITELSQVSALRVISRTSVMQYKASNKRLPEIARELNVDAVVEGSIQRSGNHIQITAQLIHAPTDRHLWAKTYERELGDILRLEKEVAEAIVNEIRIKLTLQEISQLKNAGQVDPEAHEAFLKGRHYVSKFTPADVRKAIGYFEYAIEKDPSFALAYSSLADAYFLLGQPLDTMPSAEALPKAKSLAMKAIELDDKLGQAHAVLGTVLLFLDLDWAGAEKELKKSIELSPSSADAHLSYAVYLAVKGNSKQSISEIMLAQLLDPLNLSTKTLCGELWYYAGEYNLAINQLNKTLEIDPNNARAYMVLAWVYQAKKLYPEAMESYLKWLKLFGSSEDELKSIQQGIQAEGIKGFYKSWLTMLKEKSQHEYVKPCNIAKLYVALGMNEEALQYLEKAYQEHEGELVFLKVDHGFDGLRGEPHFNALLNKIMSGIGS